MYAKHRNSQCPVRDWIRILFVYKSEALPFEANSAVTRYTFLNKHQPSSEALFYLQGPIGAYKVQLKIFLRIERFT